MKKIGIIGLLILCLSLQNCKNNEKPNEINETTEIENTEKPKIETKNTENQVEILKENEKTTTDKDSLTNDETTAVSIENIKKTDKDIQPAVDKTTEVKTDKTVVKETVEETVEETVVKEKITPTKDIEKDVKTIVTEESTVKIKIEKEVETVKETETKTVPEPVIEKPTTVDQSDDWVIPAKYKSLKNPTEASKENLSIGKSLYSKHCKSCHGKTGLGDGTKADEVEGDLGDFSSKEFQAQSDGVLYYKSYIGKDDMPNYEKKIPDEEDVWLLIHYVRSLGK